MLPPRGLFQVFGQLGAQLSESLTRPVRRSVSAGSRSVADSPGEVGEIVQRDQAERGGQDAHERQRDQPSPLRGASPHRGPAAAASYRAPSTCDRNDNGHVIAMSVTEHGANWLAPRVRLSRGPSASPW